PHSALKLHYGLGTMSGGTGDWWWFGHLGYFPGFVSCTAALPAQDVTVAIVTNAIDGLAHQWMAGTLHILRTFARHGLPSEAVRHRGGVWGGHWGHRGPGPAGAEE